MTATTDTTLRELLDRHEIAELITRYGRMADDRTFDDARSCFTEDVIAEYPSGRAEGVDVLAQYGRHALGAYERTQHVITNYLVDLDGDRAIVRANLLAVHVPRASEPGAHFDAGCAYEFDTVRTPAGWRIARLRLDAIWTAGVDHQGLVGA